MIKLNDKLIKKESFGDGTLKIEVPETLKKKDSMLLSMFASGMFGNANDNYFITWCYDNDSELFLLQCLVDRIKEVSPLAFIRLTMPYIPNARQDREVSNRLFTLKSFCKIINNMGFSEVKVLDPHSDVSLALLDRVITEDVNMFVNCIQLNYDTIMFPDLGSSKKYGSIISKVKDHNVVIGNKVRDWNTGTIKHLDIIGEEVHVRNKDILIIDDVCSFGSTYFFAGQKLKELGANNIYLYVSHCEESIYNGKLMQEDSPINKIITTDSILTHENDKVHIIRHFR